jgi:uncharacterized membrane-anchored protein
VLSEVHARPFTSIETPRRVLRLRTIGERSVAGFTTWSAFLARRIAPVMRTCTTMEARQANLSTKLARGANLLRARVDVELQQQNRDLLQSMNRRTQLQLRLQATIEGLSVAAISYYIVGLFGYPAKGAHGCGRPGRRFACHRSLRAGGGGAHLVDRAPHPPAPCGHGPD